ncbi:MAG: cupin domain-containing protein [Pseudomonadota bacterium]
MDLKDVSPAEMAGRIARFKELTPSKQAFVDTRIAEYERDIYNVIGWGVTEDPNLAPAIPNAEGFNVTYVGAEPGKGAALHAHETVEVFIPLSGRWTVYWGDEGEHEATLEAFDCISVPTGVMRGFRNAGDSFAHLIAIIGSRPDAPDGGQVAWAPKILKQAEETGLKVGDDGALVSAD